MARTSATALVFVIGLLAAAASAQPASAPAARSGPDVTPGWSLMTPEERDEHRRAMQGMRHYGDCSAYLDRHHQMMQSRMRERDPNRPEPSPRGDPCAGLPR